jgi:hypothetical protein
MLRRFTLAVLISLALVLPGQIAAAEDDTEPPVSQSENDPASTDKQPVDPVAIEKMAADVRQVPLTEDMINRFIASFKGMREVAKKFPNTKLPDSVIDEAPGSEFKHMPEDKRAAMTAVATANGFKDLEEWSVVGSSIAMSYLCPARQKAWRAFEGHQHAYLRGQGRPQAQLRAEGRADCAIGGFWAEAW